MTARETILDAADVLLRERGIAHATTKEIARAAGCSEALLYKYFADKQELFLAVLRERAPAIPVISKPGGDLRADLEQLTVALLRFYAHSFPISASLFSQRELLASWRDGLAARGAGPGEPVKGVERFLAAAQADGRIRPDADPAALAELVCGGAFQQAFFATFSDDHEFADAPVVARRLVKALALG